jgi:hypothetical protein
MKYTQELEVGMIYYLSDYTAPKVFNGLYFECLVTDQKTAAHSKVSTKTGQSIKEWDIKAIYKPERFGLPKKVCSNKIDGSCPLHNLHCQYPECEE